MGPCCSRYRHRGLGLAIAAILAGPLPAAARSDVTAAPPQRSPGDTRPPATQQAPVDLGTIVVTANKRSEHLQDVPMAVAVMTDTQLERSGAASFADYATKIPGLNTISTSPGQTQLVLRGVTSGSGQPNATVGTYIDDAPFGSSTVYSRGSLLTPDIDPYDLERIEVLRGPQGTLYGSNTLGGLVKFVTTPPDTSRASARVTAGASRVAGGGDGFATRATVNLPLVRDKLALRASAYRRTDPGYIDDVHSGRSEVNEAKVSGGRAQVLWTPDEDVSVRFSALAQNLSGDGLGNGGVDVDPATLRPLYGPMTQSRAAGTGMLKLKYRLYDLTVNADLGGATLVSTTSYGTLRLNENVDVTNAFGPLLNPLLGLPDGGYSIAQPITLNKASQELRLQSDGNQVLDWRVGLFYTRERSTDRQDVLAFDADTGVPIDLPTLSRGSIGPAQFTEWAGYGDVTWHATPRLSILLGARYSHDRTTFTQTTEGLISGSTDFTTRGSDTPTTYLVNPSYRFSDDVMGYLRVASGFRPGGPNVGVPPALGAPVTFGPDKLVSYEAGLKTSLLQRRMDLDLALFYIDWRQIQLATQQGAFSFLGNGGKASSRGVEASWTFRPTTGLSLWANATWTQARLAADTPEGGVYGLDGEALPYVPRWNASVGADYTFPLDGGWSGFVGGSYSYVGARHSDFNPVPAPRIRLPSYSSVDLHAGINYDNWMFEVYVRNLADRHGIASIGPGTLDPLAAPFTAAYQTPRTVGLSASVDF